MIINLFNSQKKAERNFIFHKERAKKLLQTSVVLFRSADTYITNGAGSDGLALKIQSAQKSEKRAISALREAIYNVEKAKEYCMDNSRRLQELRVSIDAYRAWKGKDLFLSNDIAYDWDRALSQWYREVDILIGHEQ